MYLNWVQIPDLDHLIKAIQNKITTLLGWPTENGSMQATGGTQYT